MLLTVINECQFELAIKGGSFNKKSTDILHDYFLGNENSKKMIFEHYDIKNEDLINLINTFLKIYSNQLLKHHLKIVQVIVHESRLEFLESLEKSDISIYAPK
jgi:hypothetical protein